MLCERVLGNLDANPTEFSNPPRRIDELELNWWELDRRALRKNTRGGFDVRVLLPINKFLAGGDVIYDDGEMLVTVRVAECEVLVLKPRDPFEMGSAALEVGNLHAPAEVVGNEILVVADGPVEAAIVALGIPFARTIRRLHPRRCAGMPALAVRATLEIGAAGRT
ncbi:MAG TPA: hypothetical protein VG326_00850 [Tepidisphaeraceae bacterium]|jgi:urease accessory protein|nr:hypothetical protein [Tepidisphaeraceae bacterium]